MDGKLLAQSFYNICFGFFSLPIFLRLLIDFVDFGFVVLILILRFLSVGVTCFFLFALLLFGFLFTVIYHRFLRLLNFFLMCL